MRMLQCPILIYSKDEQVPQDPIADLSLCNGQDDQKTPMLRMSPDMFGQRQLPHKVGYIDTAYSNARQQLFIATPLPVSLNSAFLMCISLSSHYHVSSVCIQFCSQQANESVIVPSDFCARPTSASASPKTRQRCLRSLSFGLLLGSRHVAHRGGPASNPGPPTDLEPRVHIGVLASRRRLWACRCRSIPAALTATTAQKSVLPVLPASHLGFILGSQKSVDHPMIQDPLFFVVRPRRLGLGPDVSVQLRVALAPRAVGPRVVRVVLDEGDFAV